MLVAYRGSPIVGVSEPGLPVGAPQPGDRAPDARGLTRAIAQFPVRLFELLASPCHSLVLYADTAETAAELDKVAEAARAGHENLIDVHAVLADGVEAPRLQVPAVRDVAGDFRTAYAAGDGTTVVVRPDGYLGYRGPTADAAAVRGYLARVMG